MNIGFIPVCLNRKIVCGFVWLLVFCSWTNSFGQDSWKNFRGNEFDGHSTVEGLANRWSAKGPPVLWTRKLGVGYSGFVGDEKYVYTQYQSLVSQVVVCLDAKTGKTIWEHAYGWSYKPASMYPGPRSTPTLSGGFIYFTTPKGEVGCLDRFSGERIWFEDLASRFEAPEIEFGYACSPTCIDGKVILPVGGQNASMVALDETKGAVVWHSGNSAISYCSAYPIEFKGRKLVVGYFKNQLTVFDRGDGKVLADISISRNYDEHSAWPIYREPYLWTAGPFRAGSRLFQIVENENVETGGLTLEDVYVTDLMSNDVASSVLVDDSVFGFDLRDVQSKVHRPSRGRFICMDFLSGKENWANGSLKQRRRLEEGMVSSKSVTDGSAVGHSSVVYADDKLILFNDTGELILCKADSNRFEQLGRARVLGGEICWAQPALIGNCYYVRNHSKAVCVYLGKINQLDLSENDIEYAGDIPQSAYFNMSAWILGVEPKYAMTAPSANWLAQWFVISLIAGWLCVPILALLTSRLLQRFVADLTLRDVCSIQLLVVGVTGTSVFGHLLGIFYFSWPIALFVTFQFVVNTLNSKNSRSTPLVARLWLVGFVAVCFGYFWLCRRLSLAFEWTFLMGFPAALPLLWFNKIVKENHRPYSLKEWAVSCLAFSLFYWVGAGVILWKYPI